MITIVDYGVGNLASIKNMFKRIGVESQISGDKEIVAGADKLLLPGVGAFDNCVSKLTESGLREILVEKAFSKKTPILGICVGMQLLFSGSEEGILPGLGWIKGTNVRFDEVRVGAEVKIPHMGWTGISQAKESRLLNPLYDEARYYFVHSYHAQLEDETDALMYSFYGYRFVAAVERDNIMGVQFHPEKSHKYGMQLLDNFANNY